MLRVEPRRWLNVVVLVALCAFLGVTLLLRMMHGREGFANALLVGGGWGAVAGAVFGLLVILYFARPDTLRAEVQKLHPRSVVLLGMRDATFVQLLKRVVRMAPTTKRLFVVSFDGDGLSLWRGVRRPERATLIPAASILAVSAVAALPPVRRGAPGYRLTVTVQGEPATELSFGVEAISLWGGTGAAGEVAVHEIARRANAVLGATVPLAVAPSYTTMTLTPGLTAWTTARLTRRVTVVLAAAFVALFGVWVYIQLSRDAPMGILFAALACSALNIAAQFVSFRAVARERAAGYTTLNRAELSLPQLHPRTGVVLRAAGAPPLSKEQFAELIR